MKNILSIWFLLISQNLQTYSIEPQPKAAIANVQARFLVEIDGMINIIKTGFEK